MTDALPPDSLAALNERIIACRRCLRLRAHCEEVARKKKLAYRDWTYWGKPVPSFGDASAAVLILGLAPGAHGSNRTGRPFTGDGSGNFLYPVLFEAGFASQAASISRTDGMRLTDCWISAVARCAPPGNKPEREELANCAPFLDQEIAMLPRLRVVVCLGRIAFDAFLAHLRRCAPEAGSPQTGGKDAGSKEAASNATKKTKASFAFFHGAEYALAGDRHLIASFHPSLQNTNTGKLTRPMLLQVFERARVLARDAPAASASDSRGVVQP